MMSGYPGGRRVAPRSGLARVVVAICFLVAVSIVAGPAPRLSTVRAAPAGQTLEEQLYGLCWMAYAPTNWSPEPPAVEPTVDSMRLDLKALRAAGVQGLVT